MFALHFPYLSYTYYLAEIWLTGFPVVDFLHPQYEKVGDGKKEIGFF